MFAIDTLRWKRASAHLDQVLDLPPEARASHLARLRAADPEAAADLEMLLEEHRRLSAEDFLGVPLGRPQPPLAGVTLGAYTLIAPLGHGGMGGVWRAARSDGRFEGEAALKLLNTALVGSGSEERFRREGTILARLTHPHIARLIDAGVAPAGQPFLVLELVNGRHIDRFCDDGALDVDARIRLFLDVQAAVAHAHANLIVHRDLKPSNVLVTADGAVKLLDFGIAKLLEQDAALLPTLSTREGSALTPKYAAPEQVTGGSITTATDVYALGVLLFELLSGRHPTSDTATTSLECVTAIAQREPLRLSGALDDVPADALAGIAARRATSPDRLRRRLRGDLETILGKALKKDPTERYVSVAAFADDLRRFLGDQPIAARPDSVAYRASKFVHRHRRVITLVTVAAIVAIGLAGFYTIRLAAERDRARLEADKASRMSELLTGLLTGADPYRDPDASAPTVRDLLALGARRATTDLADQPALQAEVFTVVGRTYERMGLFADALPLLEQALALGRRTLGEHERVAQSLNDLGVLQRNQGNLARAESLLRESLALRRRLFGSLHQDVAVTLVELARVLGERGQDAEAEPLAREALAIRTHVFGDQHRETATSKNELGLILMRRGELDAAERYLRENVATSVRLLGADHPNAAAAKGNLGLVLLAKGDAAAAEPLLREYVDGNRRALGKAHPSYAQALNSLAGAVEQQGRLAEAEALLDECLAIATARLSPEHPRLLTYQANAARIRLMRGDPVAAERILRDVLQTRERLYRSDVWRLAQARSLLGAALLAQRKYAEAELLMLAADAALMPVAGAQARERLASRARLAELYAATGRAALAVASR